MKIQYTVALPGHDRIEVCGEAVPRVGETVHLVTPKAREGSFYRVAAVTHHVQTTAGSAYRAEAPLVSLEIVNR